ncbi:MAG: hypothetical protein ABFD92_00625 [Planctomycetaceae bacterium]|nr:hypothetical protein [Planctomycetaceae bacterium]
MKLAPIGCVAFLLAAGCGSPAAPTPTKVPLTLPPVAAAAPTLSYAPLAKVLKDAVDGDGVLKASEYQWVKDDLDKQLALLAANGPTATPGQFAAEGGASAADKALAYWYNARAAWAIKLAMLAREGETITRPLLEQRPFDIDGRTMTLADIDALLAADDDWRTLPAAPGVLWQRAALPRQPLQGRDIRSQIASRFEQFVHDDKRLVADDRSREILVPLALWAVKDRAINRYQTAYGASGATLTTAMLPVVSGPALHRLQDLVGYRPVEAPWSGKLAILERK